MGGGARDVAIVSPVVLIRARVVAVGSEGLFMYSVGAAAADGRLATAASTRGEGGRGVGCEEGDVGGGAKGVAAVTRIGGGGFH